MHMATTTLTFDVGDGIGVIRLNRPEDGNAIILEMARELLDVADQCDKDPAVRAVVLTGNGRIFCAGGDLKVFAARGENASRYIEEAARTFHEALCRFNRMDPPVVGAINGAAVGGGFSLALSTDIAVAAESARFSMGYTRIGLCPDGGCSYFLARMVGLRRAKEIALLNPVFSARRAMEWGLVNLVVPDDQLMAAALQMARGWAEGPTRSFGETKRLILSGAADSLESQMERESRAIAAMAGTADGREGIDAFLAKRSPKFTGK